MSKHHERFVPHENREIVDDFMVERMLDYSPVRQDKKYQKELLLFCGTLREMMTGRPGEILYENGRIISEISAATIEENSFVVRSLRHLSPRSTQKDECFTFSVQHVVDTEVAVGRYLAAHVTDCGIVGLAQTHHFRGMEGMGWLSGVTTEDDDSGITCLDLEYFYDEVTNLGSLLD